MQSAASTWRSPGSSTARTSATTASRDQRRGPERSAEGLEHEGVDATTKRKIPEDVFYTLHGHGNDDRQTRSIWCCSILRKTNRWRSYIGPGEERHHCRSNDRVRSEMTGRTRCATARRCPDAQWKGRRTSRRRTAAPSTASPRSTPRQTRYYLLRFKEDVAQRNQVAPEQNHLGRRAGRQSRATGAVRLHPCERGSRMDEGGVYWPHRARTDRHLRPSCSARRRRGEVVLLGVRGEEPRPSRREGTSRPAASRRRTSFDQPARRRREGTGVHRHGGRRENLGFADQ